MIKMRSLPLCALASALLCSVSALAQLAAPAVRIVNPIDESQRVTLTHTVSPLANAANDRGAAPDGMLLDRIQLVLQRSPAQEAALKTLLTQLNTPGSASYHQWLTPDQFGAQFGASDQDIATVQTWLGNHGFSVTKVNAGKGTLEFSGNAGQLRDAFHTQLHKYVVNGETHYANANDPQIPAALAPVIAGFSSLNNFRARNYLHKLGEASFNPTTHQVTPEWSQGSGSGVFLVLAPGDFAKQYDLTPLYNASLNGAGQTIAIINESNINIDLVNQFRTLFGLSTNPPQVIIDGNDPGVDGVNNPDGPNYASVEAYLDVEWAGAVAPAATVDLVIAADTALENGLILAAERAVYSNVAPVLSLSFGNCESSLGSANTFINSLWEQAAAQGQTVMVSTGDAGSAGCDNDNTAEFATGGQAVNGFASTPYNVAVGGTDFYYSQWNSGSTALNNQIGTYWNTTASQLPTVSLLQTVPEQPWNNSQYGLNAVNYYTQQTGSTATTISGGGGGASGAAVCSTNAYSTTTGACTGSLSGYPKPAWQSGAGIPSDNVRDLPDVSLFAANGGNYSFYPICATDGDCQSPSGTNQVQIFGVGGTSASSPAFAGIMALVNQKWGRQGQADRVLYPLKTQFPTAFHDVTAGTNSMPCEILPTLSPNCIAVTSPITVSIQSSNGLSTSYTEGQIGTGTTAEYNAAAGYNLATGLGTIDASNLVNNWNSVALTASTTTLTPPSPTTITHGATVAIAGSVTGTTPTGNAALMTDSTEPNEQGQGLTTTLNAVNGSYGAGTFALNGSGQYSGSVTTLPGGSYNIWTSYGGDSKNAGSTSSKVAVTVNPEASGVFLQAISPVGTVTGGSSAGTSIDYGTQLALSAQVAPSTQLSAFETCTTSCPVFTLPTGTVTFNDTGSAPIAAATEVINAEGDAEFNAPFAVGTHSVTAAFNGDASYNKSTSSAITFTVVKDTPSIQLSASAVTSSSQGINGPNQPLVFTVAVLNGAQSSAATSSAVYPVPVQPPTGTVTATGFPAGVNTTATLVPAVDPANQGGTQAVEGLANFTVPAGTTAGTYNVTICYSGDPNYLGVSGSNCPQYSIPIVNTSSGSEKNSTTTATMTGSISPNSTITVTGTVTGVSGSGAPGSPAATNPGYILVYSSGYYIGQIQVVPGSGVVSNFSTTLSSQTLIQGSNLITLQYTGDNVYYPSAYTLNGGAAISSTLSDFTLVPQTTIVPVSVSGGANSGTDVINVGSINNFSGAVSLSCSAASPISCSISPSPTLSSNSTSTSTLTINVPAGTANGNFNVAISGKDSTGQFIHTLGITADVTGEVSTPTFALTNSGAITITQGATTGNTSTMTVTPANAFTGTVNLSCQVTTSPSGATSPVTCNIPATVSVTGTSAVTATLTANSTATTTTGAYVITVTAESGSITQTSTVNVTVTSAAAPGFTLSNGGNITVSPGATFGNTTTITATSQGGFSGTVNLSCAISPTAASDPATCSLASSSVTVNSTTVPTVVLTVNTTAATADLVIPKFGNGKGWLGGAGGGALLSLLIFFGIPAKRRSWRSMLGVFIALIVLGGLSSCGGGSSNGGGSNPGNNGTTAGSYTVTVTGTSGSITQTTAVNLSVN